MNNISGDSRITSKIVSFHTFDLEYDMVSTSCSALISPSTHPPFNLKTYRINNRCTTAKDILSQKALIGLADYFEESMKRFDTYFGLHRLKQTDGEQCLSNHTKFRANADRHEKYSSDSEEWKALASHNSKDVKLYEFAIDLYHQQEAFIASIDPDQREWNFRHPW